MRKKTDMLWGVAAAIAAFVLAGAAAAQDKIKIAISQKGLWDTAVAYFAAERGLFKAENLDVSYLFTGGGTETIQTLVSRSTDIIIGTGILGVLGAHSKGAPIVIYRSQILGAPESFWIVRAASPIQSVKDFNGKKVSYSRPGSTTHLIVLTMARKFDIKPELVSTGAISASRTQLMTNQIDVSYSIPPFNLDLVRSGEARIVFRATDVPELQQQTIRVNVAHKDLVEKSPDVIRRFNRAYEKALAWMYEERDAAAAAYAAYTETAIEVAREVPQFYPRERLVERRVIGTDKNAADAIEAKFITRAPNEAELRDLVRIVE
ncbi:MAG: ABC transporter substrate-binding protein [Alphaproteobacteria bacterium]|nr:ABC transporter substrate-binding protein [Alphaproteobacteria bacterium]